MPNLTSKDINNIVDQCIHCFDTLPKTGKPTESEWTVLSCVVKIELDNIEVVSLGTGSKCIGATKMSQHGDILNDSHAEICARRSFLIYLYDQIAKLLNNTQSIFICECSKFKLRKGISFVFYSSQLPCGDASIFPKNVDDKDFGDIVGNARKRTADSDICNISRKVIKNDSIDTHRTGAKCLPNAKQDFHESGINYHTLGQVRTKPGRGDRTLSVSCSDKIAKWIHMGIQGCLLDMLLIEPVYIEHFIFGAGVPYSLEALERAFFKRNVEGIELSHKPHLHQCNIVFPKVRHDQNKRPSPNSIVWTKSFGLSTEVAVMGKRLGVTKKRAILSKSSLSISKLCLYARFINIVKKLDLNLVDKSIINQVTYSEMKAKSKRYRDRWIQIKDRFFKVWTVKPDLWNFTIADLEI